MNRAVRYVLAILLAPFMPWAIYWSIFAGMNILSILAGEEFIHFASPSVVWVASLLAVVSATAFVLFDHVRKPKALL